MGRRAIFAALAACACLLAWTVPAQADPFSVSFNKGFVKIGSDPSFQDVQILQPPDTASLTGTIDTGTGNYTVPAGPLAPPRAFSFNSMLGTVSGTIQLETTAPTTGNFNSGTGVLTASVTLRATITLTSLSAKCFGTTTPTAVSFSTANDLGSHMGDDFDQGLSGAGAISAPWTDFTVASAGDLAYPNSGTICALVNGYTDGPGGAFLQNEPNAAPPPGNDGGSQGGGQTTAGTTTAAATSTPKKCKKGRKLRRGKCVKKKHK